MLNKENLENIYRKAYFNKLFELNNFAVNTTNDKPKESTSIKTQDFFNKFKTKKSTNSFLKESGIKKNNIEKYNKNNTFEKENDLMSSIKNNNRFNTTNSNNNQSTPAIQSNNINAPLKANPKEFFTGNKDQDEATKKFMDYRSKIYDKIKNEYGKTPESTQDIVNKAERKIIENNNKNINVINRNDSLNRFASNINNKGIKKISGTIRPRKNYGSLYTEDQKKEASDYIDNEIKNRDVYNDTSDEIADRQNKFGKSMMDNESSEEIKSYYDDYEKMKKRAATKTEDNGDKDASKSEPENKTSSYGQSAQNHYNNIAKLLTRQKGDVTGPYLAELAEKDIKENEAGKVSGTSASGSNAGGSADNNNGEDISGQLHAQNAVDNLNEDKNPATGDSENKDTIKTEPEKNNTQENTQNTVDNTEPKEIEDNSSNNNTPSAEGNNNQNISKTITRTFTVSSTKGTDANGNEYSETEELDPERGKKIIKKKKADGSTEEQEVEMTEEDWKNREVQDWVREKQEEEDKQNEPQDYRDLQDTWNTDIDKENKKNAGATALYESQGDATDKAQREIDKAKRKLKKAQKVGGLTAYTVGGGALLMGLMNYKRKMDEWRIRAQQAAAQGLPIPPKPGMVSSMITGGIKGAALGGVVGFIGKHTFLKGVDQSIKEGKLNDLYNNDKEFRKTYDTAHSTTDTLIAKKNKIFQDEVKGMVKNVKAGNLYTKYKDVRTIDASLQTQGGLSYWQKQLGMKDATREDILAKVTGMTPEDVKYRYPIQATWDSINRGLTDRYNNNRGPVPSNFSENCIELYNNLYYFAKCFSYLEDMSKSENEFANWIEMYYEYIQIPENYGMPLDVFLEECMLYKSFPGYVIQEIVYNKRRYQINELTQTLFSITFLDGKTRFETESQENEKLKATLPLFYKAYAERFGEKAMSFDKFKLKLITNEFFEPYILEKIRFKSIFDSKLQNFAKQPETVKIDDSNIENIKLEANNGQFQTGSGHQQVATNLNQNDLNNKIVKNNQTQNNINKQQNNFRKLDETKTNVNNNIRDINEKKNIREIQLKEKINRKAEKLNTITDPNKKNEIKNSMAMDRLKIQDNKKNADMKKNQQQEKLQNAEQKIKQMNQNNQDQQQVQVVNY